MNSELLVRRATHLLDPDRLLFLIFWVVQRRELPRPGDGRGQRSRGEKKGSWLERRVRSTLHVTVVSVPEAFTGLTRELVVTAFFSESLPRFISLLCHTGGGGQSVLACTCVQFVEEQVHLSRGCWVIGLWVRAIWTVVRDGISRHVVF